MTSTGTSAKPRRSRFPGFKRGIESSRHFWRAVMGRDLRQPLEIECQTILLGGERAEWRLCPRGLRPGSVVYSFGVGSDISFDRDLIERFGVLVHGFDPTPRSIAWVNSHELPARFVFHEYGVAGHDGTAAFSPPENSGYVSYSVVPGRGQPAAAVEAPVYRLSTILKMLGHAHVDLLKMDIEGAEYAVMDDLLASGVRAGQILVEFHHRWREIGVERTREAVCKLNGAGYRLFAVSPSGAEYSFLAP